MEFLIPSRTGRPGDDPIFALNAEARARAQTGQRVVNATVGALLDDDGKLAVIASVAQALRDVPADVGARYSPLAGPPDFLRAVIADLLGDRPEASTAVAAATPGGTGALRLAIADFLEPGQTLLTTQHYWSPYKTLADESDRTVTTFRMFDEHGKLDVADLERKLHSVIEGQGRALVFLNSPCNNPTGYSFDDEEWKRIAEVVGRESSRGPITVLLDVAYARYGATDLSSCLAAMLPLAGKAMILFAWSASKSFTQYGLRVGALVAVHPEEGERRRIENALSYSCRGTWSNCNSGGMAAITRVLVDPELRARVDRERAVLKELLDRRVARWNELATAAKLAYPRYDGGFFTTVFAGDPAGTALRMKTEGLFVVPQAGSLRIALCSVAERDVPWLVEGLAKNI